MERGEPCTKQNKIPLHVIVATHVNILLGKVSSIVALPLCIVPNVVTCRILEAGGL